MGREVATAAGQASTIQDVRRIVGLEGRNLRRLREAATAVCGLLVHDCIGVLAAADIGELPVGHVHVTVGRDGDVGKLDVVHRLAQLHRTREGCAMVGRANQINAGVETARGVPRESRPGEVDVAVAGAARAIGFDGGLVVEFAQQVRRRRAAGHRNGALILLPIVEGSRRATGVDVTRYPDVAQRLRRSLGVSGALRPHEHAAVLIPGDDRVTGAGSPHLSQGGVRRGVTRVAGDQRAHEGPTAVFRPVVPQPDRAARDRSSVRVHPVVVDPAVIVRASNQHTGVPRIDRDRRFILASLRSRALGQGRVGVRRPCPQRIRAHVSTGRLIMGQPDVGTR